MDYNFVNSLIVIKGISKKGNEYRMLCVDNGSKFNQGLVDLALKSGVREIDTTKKK